jgi:hypothetical protein
MIVFNWIQMFVALLFTALLAGLDGVVDRRVPACLIGSGHMSSRTMAA